MKTLRLIGRLSGNSLSLREQPIFHDRPSVIVLLVAVSLNVLTILVLVFGLRHTEYPVPVHYSSLVGFDQVGPWYQNYRLGLYGLATTLINVVLAVKSFRRNRLVSFYLLIGAVVVAVLCLVISLAFTAVA